MKKCWSFVQGIGRKLQNNCFYNKFLPVSFSLLNYDRSNSIFSWLNYKLIRSRKVFCIVLAGVFNQIFNGRIQKCRFLATFCFQKNSPGAGELPLSGSFVKNTEASNFELYIIKQLWASATFSCRFEENFFELSFLGIISQISYLHMRTPSDICSQPSAFQNDSVAKPPLPASTHIIAYAGFTINLPWELIWFSN